MRVGVMGTAGAVVGVASLAGVSVEGQTSMPSRVIVYEGQIAPYGTNVEFNNVRPPTSFDFNGAPVVNANGDVGFWARLTDASGSPAVGDSIWFQPNGGALTPLAVAGEPVPGMPGATYFSALGRRLIMDAQGNMAFGLQIDTGSDVVKAIGVGGNTPIRIPVYEGMTVPQTDPLSPAFGYEFDSLGAGVNFLNVYNGEEYLFNNNTLAFEASITDPTGVGPNFSPAVYVERPAGSTPTGLELVARGGFDTSVRPSGEPDALSSTGEVLFNANIDPGDDPSFSAIVTYTADISITAKTGSEAGGDISFTSLGSRPSFNTSGKVVFGARFSDLTGSDSGLFKSNDPQGIIATEGIVAAGTPDLSGDGVPDFVFNDFLSTPALINANGNVVFRHFARTPDGSQTVTGLWTDRSGTLTSLELIAQNGGEAPGLEPGTTFEQIALGNVLQNVVINANDDIAFVASFRRPDNSLGSGIWAEDDGELKLVVATGQEWDLPDGSTITLSSISFLGGSGNDDGRTSGFSDTGRLVFRGDGNGTDAFFEVRVYDLIGDYNGDGFVSQPDLDLVLLNWGDNTLPAGFEVGGLADGGPFDGLVSQNELDAVLLNWGDGALPNLSTIPEPASALALLGGLGLLARRRR